MKKIRGVDYDPNIGLKNGTRTIWNKGLRKETDERVRKGAKTLSLVLEANYKKRKPHSKETREKLSISACNRLSKNSKYSKNINYNDVVLESTYELKLAKALDEIKIKWIKCNKVKRFAYEDKNKVLRNYVPDFYLPEFDIYLDSKNDYLIEKDSYKISQVIRLHKIKLFVLSYNELNKDFLVKLIGRAPA